MIGEPSVDLRDAVRKHPLELEGLDAWSPEDLERSREHWRIHMTAEFASARVFSGLVPQMMAAGLPFEDIRDVTEMARQEIDHGLLSGRVYAALGGTPNAPLPALDPVPNHEGCSPLESVLRNILAVSCSGETLAVVVIGAERERVVHEALREILTTILKDEVGHARFGWRLLRDLAPSLDRELLRRLSAYLVVLFERDLTIMRGYATADEASFAALALGAHDGPLGWTTYLETMQRVTVPGLEQHGLAAEWAFRKANERCDARGK